jgi:CheY-like chemotaxis protein
MRILFVDDSYSIDQAALELLRARGHDLKRTRIAVDALDLIRRNEFDCIFLDLSTIADSLGLAEIRALARTSGVILIGASPVESLVADSLSTGHLEFQPIPVLIAHMNELVQPTLLVASEFDPRLTHAIKKQRLRAFSATTLPFAMNLMVDGWCQIVCLNAQIPGPIQPEHVAIVHHVGARETAILASVLPGGGIMFTQKPPNPNEFVSLIRYIAENRPIPCGLLDNFATQRNRD